VSFADLRYLRGVNPHCVADKHGVRHAQRMSGNVSIREVFRYTKPSAEEIAETAEGLF
jgi:integrase/recombinase XerD